MRGNSIDDRQYFSIDREKTWHTGGERVQTKVQVISKYMLYPPGKIEIFG